MVRGSPLDGPLLFSIDTLNRARIIFKDLPCVLKVFQTFVQSTIKASYAMALYIARIEAVGFLSRETPPTAVADKHRTFWCVQHLSMPVTVVMADHALFFCGITT